MKLIYSRQDQRIYANLDNGEIVSFECHNDFEEGYNENGEPRESLPIGEYVCNAETPGEDYGKSYGTFYIYTGDSRGRDIHGGGSILDDPYAPYQGWLCTYGCLRMQNADGQELSRLIIAAGNGIPLTVQEGSYNA